MDEITDRQERVEAETVYPSASVRREAVVASAPAVRAVDPVPLPPLSEESAIDADLALGDAGQLPRAAPGASDVEAPVEAPERVDAEVTAAPLTVAPVSVPVSARIPVVEPFAAPAADAPRAEAPAESRGDTAPGPEIGHADAAVADEASVAPFSAMSPPFRSAAQRLPEVTARIIPFVPRGGSVRDVARIADAPAPQPFARQAAPYFISPADGGQVPPPAVPPPPSGYRRPVERVRAASPTVPALPAAGGAETVQAPATPFSLRAVLGRLNPRLIVRRTFQILGALVFVYTTLVIGLMVAYRWVDPPMSALMLGQRLSGTQVTQTWMPLERISPNLQLAVILSEDGRFCTHHGVDWGELKEAVAQSLDGFGARGGSTISMQTVKNLFLWPSKSYVRKAVEIPLALGTEKMWPKERMLEIYLNIAEWGPGIFGAEAAARYHFGKSAATLTAREASLLAVSLPNPFDRQAGRPGAGTQRLADNIQARMRRLPNAAACGKPGRPPNRTGVADSRWP